MSDDKIGVYMRALERERAARREAERILEEKSAELYEANEQLTRLNRDLESLLTRTDSQLQGVFENIVDPYVIMDLTGNILKMNNAAIHLLGFENDKVDFNLMDMVLPSEYDRVAKSFKTLLKKGTLTDFEIEIKTKNEELKIVHINASIIYDKDIPVAAQGIIRDITLTREKEFVVEVINDIAQSILGKFDLYEIAYQITDKIATYLESNDCVIYLYHEDENTLEQISAYGEKLDENNQLVNKIILKEGEGIVGAVAKSGIAEIVHNTELDKRYVKDIDNCKSEISIPILLGNKVIGVIDSEHPEEGFFTNKHLDMLNSIANIVALQLKSAIDLRERKLIEEQLIESENRLSTLILNLDSGVLLEDENRKIVVTNRKFCEFFKIPVDPSKLVGEDCTGAAEQSKMHFLDPQSFVSRINTILNDKKAVLGEELRMADGTILERDYIPIFKNNTYKGHLWTYKDVTLKRKYSKSLEAQKQKYSNIIANMNLGLIEVSLDDEILMANNSFVKMSGYSEDELIGKVANEVFTIEKDKATIKKENDDRKKGVSNSYEIRIKRKDGANRVWLVSGAPNYNLNGEVIGSIGIHLDITDIKNLQRQKEALVKDLETTNNELQEYAHIVSHDLKSPLRSINALVNWIKEDNKEKLDEASLQNIALIEVTLEKMEQLISDILDYSSVGSDKAKKETIDLNHLMKEILPLLHVPDHITISINKPLPKVKGDCTMLQQLFQNLLSNAVRYNDKKEGQIEINYRDKNSFYQFSVKDNGIGIDKKYHDKIFKLFHSLNKRKDSTGIGLSIVKKIVETHNGKIWLESEPGEGTTFYFTIKK
ncbi:MAG: PAS domain S-box protein [Winogradskyella sp.]|nr:PAS domain S-box protein [Winogradskyella sp.]NNK39826.1 PAS domain S-box protein [Winogradskyella sp.]